MKMTTENENVISNQTLKEDSELNEDITLTSSNKNRHDVDSASNLLEDKQQVVDIQNGQNRRSCKSLQEFSRIESEDVFEDNFAAQSTLALRASHDTLNVELSDDDDSDLSDDGSDEISDNAGVTCCRIDSDTGQHWDKEYVWQRDIKLLPKSIHPNDTASHVIFERNCQKLCDFSLTSCYQTELQSTADQADPTANTDLHHRLITAKELLPQLDLCYAYMHGGGDMNNSRIICLPHYSDFRDITDENFCNTLFYLTSLVRPSPSGNGFVIVLDRRRDKWSSVRRVLSRLTSNFPGDLKMILVLRPAGFLQRKASDFGFRLRRDQLSTKVQIEMLTGVHELKKYMKPDEIPREFGGSFVYCHKTWIRNRMLLEDFASHAVDIGRDLDTYGKELGETELPLDVPSTQTLLQSQQEAAQLYKTELDCLIETAITLKSTINIPSSFTKASPASYLLEAKTLQSAMSTIEEVDAAFGSCWMKHEGKLQQCLELRQFEEDYLEATSKLSIYKNWCEQQSDHVGTNSSWVEYLINEAERMKENFMECSVEYSLLSTIGGGMMENNYYVTDHIASKCNELERILSDLNQLFESRVDFLNQMHDVLLDIEELNLWCDRAMSLLAGQGIEKAQSMEGSQQALTELEEFFGKTVNRGPVAAQSVSQSLENYMKAVNSRFDEVVQLYEKRRSYFLKTISRYSERPVQRVEPSIKADYAPELHANIQGADTAAANPPSTAQPDPQVQLRHVMNELLSTEEMYVKELKTIIEGYGHAIDDENNSNLVPKELKGNAKVLLGNMEDIYAFHSKIFLKDLEECKNTPALVGKCFINRKNDFAIYSKYCQNSAKSEQLRSRVGEQHPFLVECQRKLGHLLPLSAYLLKPIQRITKYQLLLKQMLKYSSSVGAVDIQAALDTMLGVLKLVNDSMHRKAIVGYQGNLEQLGGLLLQAPFSVQSEHRKVKVKNITRHRFSKTSQRHLFLFEKELLFCKQQNLDSTDNNLSSNPIGISSISGGAKPQCYVFKHSLNLSAVGITENSKGDSKKFEIWYQGREEVYTLLAVSAATKQGWVSEMKKVLLSLPKIQVTLKVNKDKRKNPKARRRKSQSKKPRSGFIFDKQKMNFDFADQRRTGSIKRSASVGKDESDASGQPSFQKSLDNICSNEDEIINGNTLKKSRKSLSLPRLSILATDSLDT